MEVVSTRRGESSASPASRPRRHSSAASSDSSSIADRTGLELFAADGLTYIPLPMNLDPRQTGLKIRVGGGPVRLDRLEAYELRTIWPALGGSLT